MLGEVFVPPVLWHLSYVNSRKPLRSHIVDDSLRKCSYRFLLAFSVKFRLIAFFYFCRDIHQQNYVKNIVKRFGLENARPNNIPADPGAAMTSEIGNKLENKRQSSV